MPIPFAIPECRVGSCVEQRPNHLTIEVLPDAGVGRCPACDQASRSVHSRYHRHPADLPLSTSQTTLSIEVRRFYCHNPCCSRRTFAEPMSDLLGSRARRTRRLAETQGRVGIVCGGAGGVRLLKHLRMPASRATVLRLVRAMPMPDGPTPVHVGVDDWAMRKGRGYGTIVVDLDRHRVVDLLPDRTAATLAGWIVQRPGIKVVARDRSKPASAPTATYIADPCGRAGPGWGTGGPKGFQARASPRSNGPPVHQTRASPNQPSGRVTPKTGFLNRPGRTRRPLAFSHPPSLMQRDSVRGRQRCGGPR